MSDFEILYRRIGQQGVDRLMKLGFLTAPIAPNASEAIPGETKECLVPAPHKDAIVSVFPNHQTRNSPDDKDASEEDVLRQLEVVRRIASQQLDQDKRAHLGQFMTPAPIANFMASLFQRWPSKVSLLEPGAGIGSLAYAFGRRFLEQNPDGTLSITAYEIDPTLLEYLSKHLSDLRNGGRAHVETTIIPRDFLHEAAIPSSFQSKSFTHVILNPPYRKIGGQSEYRRLLRLLGVEAGNLYAAFLALSIELTSMRAILGTRWVTSTKSYWLPLV